MGQESSNRWCLLSQFSVKVLAQSMPNFHLILDEKLDELHLHLSTEALIYFREKYDHHIKSQSDLYWNSWKFCAFSRPLCAYDQAKPKIFYILPKRHEVLTLQGEEDLKVWQYGPQFSESAKIWLSKSIFYVKNDQILSNNVFIYKYVSF